MNQKIHFPGLNGIRAIAAMTVLIFHIDQFLPHFDLKPVFHGPGMAEYAVTLFFVLSGYLITHLLLLEKEKFQKIDLPKFYIRRILRIWPIYYAVLFIGLLIFLFLPGSVYLPEGSIIKTFVLYSFLLSNVGYGMGLGISTIMPLWSVGVEEQFYAFWPLLLNKSKNIIYSLLSVIIIYLLVKVAVHQYCGDGKIYKIIHLCCFDCMAIGGIGAYLVYTKSKYLRLIYNPFVQLAAWLFLAVSIFHAPVHLYTIIDNELHALFYIVIIINVSSNNKTLVNLENRLFDFIGQLSYGIYVYHVTVIVLLSWLMKNVIHYNFTNTSGDYILVFSVIIMLTFVISFLSYTYFESFFLRLKNRYAKIESKAWL